MLTQKEIGQRIALLRKDRGLSQEELAKNIRMSRSSLAQIEVGNRAIDAQELYTLSMALRFSMDAIMQPGFKVEHEITSSAPETEVRVEERISVPHLKVEKFKNVLLYILERCAGKPNVGETVLYKLLYFSDFNYYELYEEQMTGATYRKLQFGPVPQKMESIVNDMINAGQLQRIKTDYFDKVQTRYIPLVKPDLTMMKASEIDTIDRVIDQMGDWSATMISDYSHGDKPWKVTAEGEALDYELAFYRRPPYSVRVYKEDEEDTI